MITKINGETSKQYQAFCDYWRLGPGRNLNKLLTTYKGKTSPPCKTYNTLKRWALKNNWDERIASEIEAEQKVLEDTYKEKLIENSMRQFDVLDDMYTVLGDMDIDTELVSVAQATTLYNAFINSVSKIFNLDGPIKIAPTDPTGKKEYKADISELLKLADAAKRRPE